MTGEDRDREFSRRALLRAGWAVPVVLAAGVSQPPAGATATAGRAGARTRPRRAGPVPRDGAGKSRACRPQRQWLGDTRHAGSRRSPHTDHADGGHTDTHTPTTAITATTATPMPITATPLPFTATRRTPTRPTAIREPTRRTHTRTNSAVIPTTAHGDEATSTRRAETFTLTRSVTSTSSAVRVLRTKTRMRTFRWRSGGAPMCPMATGGCTSTPTSTRPPARTRTRRTPTRRTPIAAEFRHSHRAALRRQLRGPPVVVGDRCHALTQCVVVEVAVGGVRVEHVGVHDVVDMVGIGVVGPCTSLKSSGRVALRSSKCGTWPCESSKCTSSTWSMWVSKCTLSVCGVLV